MKKIFSLALAALTVFAALSCKQETIDALTVESSEITFSNAGGSQSIAFTSNVAWTASADQEWITLSKASGDAGTVSLTVSAAANTNYSTRTGNVTVVAGKMKSIFKVTQSEPEVFELASVYHLNAEAQELVIGVRANKKYEVEIDSECSSWVSLSPASRSNPEDATVTFIIAANNTLESRSGEVTIKTNEGDFQFAIVQDSNFSEASSASATYISNVQKIYDNENYCPTQFGQYIVKLNCDGKEVALALNVAKKDVDKAVLPSGVFACDYAAAYAPSTFSLKDIEGKNKFYTTIKNEDGTETLVEDGEIAISKDGKTYSIAAALVDEKGNALPFSYVGEIAVDDQSIGLQVSSVDYKGDYFTYFGNDNSQWDLSFYVTEALNKDLPYIYYFGVDVFDGKGIVDPQNIPTGTFQINKEEKYADLPYASGKRLVDNMTFDGGQYGSADYDYEKQSSKTAAIKDGTVAISKNEDGTYNYDFELVFNVTAGYYNDDWEWIETENKDVNWAYTFNNVTNPVASDNTLRPELDKGAVFSYASPIDAYSGMWYGDTYSLGTNVFLMGWASGVNAQYTVYIPLMTTGEWEYVKNYANIFCNTPIPEGTYTYVEAKPTEGGNYICNIKSAARKAYVKNGYTGSTVYVNKGSITIGNGKVTFDLEGTLKLADGTETGETLKYTGELSNSVQYFQNYSAASRQSQMAWNE